MPLLTYERAFWPHYPLIGGVDEAGMGAWAGPVVAAAVIFARDVAIPGVDDSKKIPPQKREKLFDVIRQSCLSYGIGVVDAAVIDEINILQASKQAMLIAINQLKPRPDHLFIDGRNKLPIDIPQTPIIDGDAKSHSIAAASILAKVTRDSLMIELARSYPGFGFERHKGYGTERHRLALADLGLLPVHRKSYEPIRKLCLKV